MQKTILSTVDVARLFNVTETTVKRWADDGTLKCQRTPGGHRKFEMRHVVEFAENHSFEPTGILEMPAGDALGTRIELAVLHRDFQALVEAFMEKALSPDPMDLYVLFSYLYEHRIQLWEIYDLVLQPGMQRIGEQWKQGKIGIGQEHRASYETLDALARLQAEVREKPPTGNSVLLACLGEEAHEIGLRCIANLFESEGWGTHYVGARTPVEAIVEIARELKPTLVAVSVTQSGRGIPTQEGLRSLSSALQKLKVRLVVGGSGAPAEIHGWKHIDAVIASSREMLQYIEGVGSGTNDPRQKS